MEDIVQGIVAVALIGFFYFLPSINAASRHKRNVGAIFMLNAFLGWTVLGWIGALIWSALYEEKRPGKARAGKFVNQAERWGGP